MDDSVLQIRGGTVYDPANGIDGEVRDLWIHAGRIVDPPQDPHFRASRVIDATGLVVMPGGIDMHCHVAGPKVNMARKLRPDDKRRTAPVERGGRTFSGTMGSVPSTFATAYKYAGMGYTTVFDAAIAPLMARHVHEEFADIPCLDKGFFVLAGNNHFIMDAIRRGEPERLRGFLGWLLSSCKAFAPKIVNPGGVEIFKNHADGNARDLDAKVDHYDVTPRQIIAGIARAAAELGLPHPVHVHSNNLGVPGNWTTTLETMRALDGNRGHLAHIQFHSYAGGERDDAPFGSAVPKLAEYVNSHRNVSVDVGQVMFGQTTSMTADSPLGYYLQRIFGAKWFSGDTELESGCGIVPIQYKNRRLVHAWQWAVGLEWFLLVDDPWRCAMSTDHPNGASFLAYPELVRLLMDATYRRDVVKTLHPAVRKGSLLADLDREFTLQEICIISRAAPARLLGLTNKGHLGPGADADITIYTPHENRQEMFELPRFVIKSGQVIVESGEIREPVEGRTLHVSPEYDPAIEKPISEWFDEFYTVRMRNYPVDMSYLPLHQVVECGPRAS